jgi:aminoglycoside phosphotransferase (APT) family kinase protein
MADQPAPAPNEHEIALFIATNLGRQTTRIARTEAFATNAVYEVDVDGRRFMLKASSNRDALRAEAWACARAYAAGFPAPEILVDVLQIGLDSGMAAFVMSRVVGEPITKGHTAFRDLGAAVRRLHEVKLPGFGPLADATWDQRDGFTMHCPSWFEFLTGICNDTRRLAESCAIASFVADAVETAMQAHADELTKATTGSLCHGDLKANHIFVEHGALTGVIDWGDAVVGDPCWEVARYAHRGDAESLSLLLRGYDPDGSMADELAWRIPLYSVLWLLVDAVVDHRLGVSVDVLNTAMRDIERIV